MLIAVVYQVVIEQFNYIHVNFLSSLTPLKKSETISSLLALHSSKLSSLSFNLLNMFLIKAMVNSQDSFNK